MKDPVWKYKWVQAHEPENFKRVHKWLDVKEFLICKMTGEFVMTQDSAFAALIYDIRKGKEGWSREMCDMLGVNMNHLAPIKQSTDKVGEITEKAASELGLKAGTAVFGGGGDASLIGVGAGSTALGDTHIYCGTSGWVSTVVDKSIVDASAMVAAIVGAQPERFNYFAELETAGKCLEWVKDHLALDEIDIYLEKKHVAESQEAVYTSLYDYMAKVISEVPAGSNGVIFTPWLHGNRCPFEDPNARGMFFNISLETGKTELIRAVTEGVCFHLRWFLETEEKKIKTSDTIRFVGGGALSDVTCQILADCIGRKVETVEQPQTSVRSAPRSWWRSASACCRASMKRNGWCRRKKPSHPIRLLSRSMTATTPFSRSFTRRTKRTLQPSTANFKTKSAPGPAVRKLTGA